MYQSRKAFDTAAVRSKQALALLVVHLIGQALLIFPYELSLQQYGPRCIQVIQWCGVVSCSSTIHLRGPDDSTAGGWELLQAQFALHPNPWLNYTGECCMFLLIFRMVRSVPLNNFDKNHKPTKALRR